MTWGGVKYPWSSPKVLAPLLAGLTGLCIFLAYEAKFARNPVVNAASYLVEKTYTHNVQVPFDLMASRTGCSGYLQTFIIPIMMMILICTSILSDSAYVLRCIKDYMPVYFQGSKAKSVIGAGVDMLPLALLAVP
jgi:hypothetical protein